MIAYFLQLVLFSIMVSNSCHCQSIQESIKDDGYLKHDPEDENGKHYLWEIKGAPSSYIFGTTPVPFTLVWDAIPQNVMQAFHNAQLLYLETTRNEDTMLVTQSCTKLPNNQTVSDILPYDMYVKLLSDMEYLQTKIEEWLTTSQKNLGVFAYVIFDAFFDEWETHQPIWTLMQFHWITKTLARSIEHLDLDPYLEDLGKHYDKYVGGFEIDMCSFFDNISESQALFILNKTLGLQNDKLLEIRENYWNDRIRQYRDGTISQDWLTHDYGILRELFPFHLSSTTITGSNVSKHIKTELGNAQEMAIEIEAYLRDQLFFKTNLIMTERIMDLIKSNNDSSFFFAIDSFNLIGNHSVLDMLKQRSVNTVRMSRDTVIPVSNTRRDIIQQVVSFILTCGISGIHNMIIRIAME